MSQIITNVNGWHRKRRQMKHYTITLIQDIADNINNLKFIQNQQQQCVIEARKKFSQINYQTQANTLIDNENPEEYRLFVTLKRALQDLCPNNYTDIGILFENIYIICTFCMLYSPEQDVLSYFLKLANHNNISEIQQCETQIHLLKCYFLLLTYRKKYYIASSGRQRRQNIIHNLEKKNDQLYKEYCSISFKYMKNQKTNNKLKDTLKTANTQINELNSKVLDLDSSNETLTTKIIRQKQAIQDLQNEIDIINYEISQLLD
jgi:hypothetical protein